MKPHAPLRTRAAIFLAFAALLLTPFIAPNAHAQSKASSAESTTFRGAYFEIKHPKDFVAKPLDAKVAKEASAATFSSPDGAMTFYIFSPQWGGDAPSIALDTSREVEASRKAEKGKSSGVEGKYTWTTIAAKDKSYTRIYQDFLATDGSIHWVIGMKYKSDAVLQQYKSQYAAFKTSLRQLSD
jgi:hypothetical protein